MSLLREFFSAAQDANVSLISPGLGLGGPPMMNLARRAGRLADGKRFVQNRDGNGLTLHDRVKAALAEALTSISRRM